MPVVRIVAAGIMVCKKPDPCSFRDMDDFINMVGLLFGHKNLFLFGGCCKMQLGLPVFWQHCSPSLGAAVAAVFLM